MKKIVFVILHYNCPEVTLECISSIKRTADYDNYHMVVVDNHSPDASGLSLKKRYKTDKKVTVIMNRENLGYAKGNNIGYSYAKNVLKADYIIIPNNDILFCQDNYIKKIMEIYEETHYGILGPDIQNLEGIHQNPMKKELISRSSVLKIMNRYRRERIKNAIMLLIDVPFLYQWLRDKKRLIKKDEVLCHERRMENVTLFGACIIYSPLYIQKMDYAFFSEPFLYFEEDLLHYVSAKNGLKTVFDPSIRVIHKEKQSTASVYRTRLSQRRFYIEHVMNSLAILYRLMKEDRYRTVDDINRIEEGLIYLK